jgi:ACS family sodium-dependent inorganic phosphate cotransporter
MGEGVAFPAIHSMLARWIPPQERSRAVSFIISATYIGTILPLASAPEIVSTVGWPAVFYIFGALGIVWYFGWQFICSGSPQLHTTIHPHEQHFIKEQLGRQENARGPIPWKNMLRAPAVWAIIINQFCSSYAFYTLLSWLPTYFDENYNISFDDLSIYAVLPYIVQGLCGILSGILADFLIHRSFSVTLVRKSMQSAGLLLPAVFYAMLALIPATSIGVTTLLMSLALGTGTLTLAGVSVNHLDIAPKYSGIIFAMGNTSGTIAGIVGTTLSGNIVQVTASWQWVFGSMVIMSLLGTLSWLTMSKGVLVREIESSQLAGE